MNGAYGPAVHGRSLAVALGLHVLAAVLLFGLEPEPLAQGMPKALMVSLYVAGEAVAAAMPEPAAVPARRTVQRPEPVPAPAVSQPIPPPPPVEPVLVALTRDAARETLAPQAPAPQPPETAPAPVAAPPIPAPPEAAAPVHSSPSTGRPGPVAQDATSAAPSPAPVPTQALELPRFDADYLHNPAPIYPPMSRRLREQGTVTLRVRVTPDGRATQVEVRESSGYPRLDKAAEESVRRWRFVPARQGGQTVAAWVLVPISYSIRS